MAMTQIRGVNTLLSLAKEHEIPDEVLSKLTSRLSFRVVAGVVVSLVLLLAIFWRVELDDIRRGIASIDLGAIVAALGFLSLSILAACFRYWNILRTFGQDIGLVTTIRANLLGLVGGLLFFQVIGQTLSRWVALRRAGVSPSSVVVTSLYERVLALVILLGAALIAAGLLYDGISLELQQESLALAKSFVLIVLSAIAISAFVLRRHLKLLWRSLRRGTNWRAVAIGVVLTAVVHGAMLAAYLSLIRALAPHVALMDLAAASIIIMFAASFPISFAGWGIRELGAVFAFGFVGVEAGNALAVSIMIGVLSIAAVAVLTGLVVMMPASVQHQGGDGPDVVSTPHIDLTRFLFLAIPFGVAGLVMFHVWLPVGESFINLNLADPLALMGGILFLLYYKRLDFSDAFPRVFLLLGTLTLLLLAGLIHGWWRFGYTDWAFINRGVGWLFILGYVATGGMLMVMSPKAGIFVAVRILMWVAVILIVADLVLWLLPSYGYRGLLSITSYDRFHGESLNPNAFALQLLLIFAGVLSLVGKTGQKMAFRQFEPVIFGLFFAGIYLTQSRTAFITSAFLLAGVLVLGFKRWDLLVKGGVVALVVLLFLPNAPYLWHVTIKYIGMVLEYFGTSGLPSLGSGFARETGLSVPLYRPGSELERWQSIINGFALFREYPVFGAGLGAGFHNSLIAGKPLVIHSTPVWILAEFGLAGAVLVGTCFLSVALYSLQKAQNEESAPYRLGLLWLLVFAVFGLPHDIFYQRLFWFFLGAILFKGIRLKDRRGRSAEVMTIIAPDRAQPVKPAHRPVVARLLQR